MDKIDTQFANAVSRVLHQHVQKFNDNLHSSYSTGVIVFVKEVSNESHLHEHIIDAPTDKVDWYSIVSSLCVEEPGFYTDFVTSEVGVPVRVALLLPNVISAEYRMEPMV